MNIVRALGLGLVVGAAIGGCAIDASINTHGHPCSINGDCCIGSTCIQAIGSTQGICGTITPPPGGTPPASDAGAVDGSIVTCAEYGQTCSTNADCCNASCVNGTCGATACGNVGANRKHPTRQACLDEQLAHWARRKAADENTSVSKLVARLLDRQA